MQAPAIANAATISQAPPSTPGTPTPAAGPDSSAVPGGLPSFAQVVREILVRTTTQDATQPAHTSRPNSSAAPAPQDNKLAVPPHGTPSQPFPQLVDPTTLSLVPFLNQFTLVQQLPSAPSPVSPTQTPSVTKQCQSSTTPVSSIASDPQSGGPCPTKGVPGGTTPPPVATTQGTLPTSLTTVEIQLSVTQPSSAPNPYAQSNPPRPANRVAVDPPPVSDNNSLLSPAAPAKKVVDLEILSNTPPTLAGISISSAAQQLAALQPTAPPNLLMTVVPSFATPHSPGEVQGSAKNAPVSAPPVTTLPTLATTPPSSLKNAPLVHAETRPVIPSANSSSMNQSASQDNSSSNLDAPKSTSSSISPSATSSHDAVSFAQALANAGNANAKPDATPAETSQQPAVLPVSAPSTERLTQPAVAAPPAASPANPPQTAFHSLETSPTPTVSEAQVSQSSGHSEMRIAMQTDKLGAVELHTRVAGDEIGAAITVEKRDAHAALSVELPALQQALSEKQLRVDQITLLHGPLHSTTGDASGQPQSQGQQQGDRRTPRESSLPPFVSDSGSAFPFSQATTESSGIFDSHGRLSVEA